MSKVWLFKLFLFSYTALGISVIAVSLLFKKSLSRAAWFFLLTIGFAGSIWFWGYRIEPYWIRVGQVVIHDAELAQAVGDLKIVHITDIHMNRGIRFREKQLVRKVNALKPDLIFFTGDIIDNTDQIAPAIELFSQMKANLGIYGVPGDTDLIFMGSRMLAAELGKSGMRMLNNENIEIRLPNERLLRIAGITNPHEDNLRKALGGIPFGSPFILLSPAPEIFPAAAREGVNLLLTGDTHGGQIGIDFIIRLSEYANRSFYMRGLFHEKTTTMYVNRGIGTKTRNVRFLCPPEIAVIKVRP